LSTTQLQTRVGSADGAVAVIELTGDVTAACENELMEAYREAGGEQNRGIVLDFTGLDYMNSSGIGLLVTFLVRAKRAHQQLAAYGLSDHYRQIFDLTRLDEVISVHADERAAVAAAAGSKDDGPVGTSGGRAPGV
jgi:anti-sigma B factor antagonist